MKNKLHISVIFACLTFFTLGTFAQQSEREIRLQKIEPNGALHCASGPVTIGVVVDNWLPGMSYSWSTGQTDSAIVVNPMISTTYYLTVENQDENFIANVQFYLQVESNTLYPKHSGFELPNTECLGKEVTVAADHQGGYAPFTYAWPDGHTSRQHKVSVTGNEEIVVTVTDACGRKTQSIIDLRLEKRLPLNAPEQLAIEFGCEGDNLSLEPDMEDVSGGVGHGYQFTFTTWEEAMTALKMEAVDGASIPVKVTDACAQDMAIVELNMYKAPIEIPEISDLIVCARDSTDVVQDVPRQVYYWHGGGFTTSQEVQINRDTEVTLTYIDRCSDQHPVIRHVKANEPIAKFDYQLENSTGKVELDNFSQGENLQFVWYVDGEEVSAERNPQLNLTPEKESEVTLEITDAQGCTATESRRITPVDHVSIPSAFTPNGDGTNDFFFVQIEEHLVAFNLEIFDRWGQLIYATNDQYFTWDGRHKSSDLPLDTYVYKMVGETHAGDVIEKIGTITILNRE